MNAEPNSNNAAPAMEPAFKDFFDKVLPKNGGSNTLALGESHGTTEHLQWLQQHLPQLKENYGITTIGIEHTAYMNPLFWAYKDGTLATQLGGKPQAKNYVRAMLKAPTNPKFHENTSLQADLLMSAMDAGIDVVAYDSRHSYIAACNDWGYEVREYKQMPENYWQKNRKNADFLKKIGNESIYERLPWLLMEVAWLKQLKPQYKAKFDAAEQLIACGHQKINACALTSDALSATLFNAMAQPTGNRITIGGAAHIDGVGCWADRKKIEQVHGTFGHHLFAMGLSPEAHRPHQVTAAVMATTAVEKDYNSNAVLRFSNSIYTSVRDHQIHHLDLDNSNIEPLWQPKAAHKRAVRLEGKFSKKPIFDLFFKDEVEATAKAQINPLLIPDIKAASDELRTAMHGPSNDRPR